MQKHRLNIITNNIFALGYPPAYTIPPASPWWNANCYVILAKNLGIMSQFSTGIIFLMELDLIFSVFKGGAARFQYEILRILSLLSNIRYADFLYSRW